MDHHGLPLTVSTHAANHQEVTLAQLSFDFHMIEAKPGNLIGNRAYDSDPLNRQLREQGIERLLRTNRTASPNARKTAVDCAATSDAGSLNVSLPGYEGADGCWYGGNFIPPTSSTSSGLHASVCCLSGLEMGSSNVNAAMGIVRSLSDIEGGEFGLLHRERALLRMTRKLAIEVHAFACDVQTFIHMLKEVGFTVRHIQRDPDGTATVLARRD